MLLANSFRTTRKEAFGPPQKYQDQDDPVLILALVSGHLRSCTFEVNGKVQELLVPGGNTWCYHPILNGHPR